MRRGSPKAIARCIKWGVPSVTLHYFSAELKKGALSQSYDGVHTFGIFVER